MYWGGGVAITLVIMLLFFILPKNNNQNKPPDNLSNKTVIDLDDDVFFTERTYSEVHLRAGRWNDITAYGENYNSIMSIRFSYKHKDAIKDIMKKQDGAYFKLRLTGTIDKECKYLKIYFYYIIGDQWIVLANNGDNRLNIGPGDFSEEFLMRNEHVDIDTLPENGIFVISIINELLNVNDFYLFDTGERIPDNMPNDTIWATIRDLKIEPVL